MNDFTGLEHTPGLKAIQIVFDDWKHVISLLVNYILFICPYQLGVAESVSYVRPSENLDDIIENNFFQALVCHVNDKYSLPVGISALILVPFFYYNIKNPVVLYDLLNYAMESYLLLESSLKKNALEFTQKLFSYFPSPCQGCLMSLEYALPGDIAAISLIPFAYHIKNLSVIRELLNRAVKAYALLEPSSKNRAIEYIHKLLSCVSPQCQISLLSLAYEITREKKYILRMMENEIIQQLDCQQKASIFWNIKNLLFSDKLTFNIDEIIIFRRYYQSYVDGIAAQVHLPSSPKPIHFRNKNRIVLITSQLLKIGHAPTRNAFDYSRNLKKIGKEVFIINSADYIKQTALAFYDWFNADFIKEYSNNNTIDFENERYPFYQSKLNMPNLQDIQKIIDLVNEFNPELVISVGDATLTADICSYFTTVVAIPCGGVLPMYPKDCWAVPRKFLPSDRQIFQAFGIPEERVFSIHYTFMKKEKKRLSRRDLKLPQDAFILCVVGNRLDLEVTPDFIAQLEQIVQEIPEVYLLFIGGYQNYDRMAEQHRILRQKSVCLGYRGDIQSIYPLCNAYLNPKRQGGATSGAEAMLDGLPVITQAYGDVYYQLWLKQSFDTTDDIIIFLKKCIHDPDFYLDQKKQAKCLGRKLFDTAGMMQEVLVNMEKYFCKHEF
ncbi:hypothetical protein [Lucifera butyrica]|uniref:hypothetical protein n=1 Tax=Lucifera butyrica TaxID=1351585 RepID=UPI000F89771D|nr:hypothetical protein [Lucifera butyrica]